MQPAVDGVLDDGGDRLDALRPALWERGWASEIVGSKSALVLDMVFLAYLASLAGIMLESV